MTDEETARKLFAQECDFVLAATEPAHFPVQDGPDVLPEVSFIGRSNVGKSSLINGLTGRKRLARASNTPGRTQQIIFFNLTKRLMLVDLPGYGHASAPLETMNQWNNLVRCYIQKHIPLKLLCLLIDSRHGAMAHDLEMMKFLDRIGMLYQVVLTKADQVRPNELTQKVQQTEELLARHAAAKSQVIVTSSEKNIGMSELKQLLADYALPPIPKVY